jgi:hypothetical protein
VRYEDRDELRVERVADRRGKSDRGLGHAGRSRQRRRRGIQLVLPGRDPFGLQCDGDAARELLGELDIGPVEPSHRRARRARSRVQRRR